MLNVLRLVRFESYYGSKENIKSGYEGGFHKEHIKYQRKIFQMIFLRFPFNLLNLFPLKPIGR